MDKHSIEILQQRAIQLAKPKSETTDFGIQYECLIFGMNHSRYAVETRYVTKVLHVNHISILPSLPPFILGVINDGGKIISINNGSKIFHFPEIELLPPYKILVLKTDQLEIGLVVEEVLGIKKIAKSAIHEDAFGNQQKSDFQIGLTNDHILFLDGNRMLNMPGLKIDQSKTE